MLSALLTDFGSGRLGTILCGATAAAACFLVTEPDLLALALLPLLRPVLETLWLLTGFEAWERRRDNLVKVSTVSVRDLLESLVRYW